jgi:hypothetical protein
MLERVTLNEGFKIFIEYFTSQNTAFGQKIPRRLNHFRAAFKGSPSPWFLREVNRRSVNFLDIFRAVGVSARLSISIRK